MTVPLGYGGDLIQNETTFTARARKARNASIYLRQPSRMSQAALSAEAQSGGSPGVSLHRLRRAFGIIPRAYGV